MFELIIYSLYHILLIWCTVAYLCVVVCFSVWLCASSCTNTLFLPRLQKKSVYPFFQIMWTQPNLKNWKLWSLRREKNKKQLYWISPFHMLQIPLQCCWLQSRVQHPVFSPARLPILQTLNRLIFWQNELCLGQPGCSQSTATPRGMPVDPTMNRLQGRKPVPPLVSMSKN